MNAYSKKMLAAGARGYVTKNSSKEELFMAICKVYKGSIYICDDLKDKTSNDPQGKEEILTARLNTLTRRELDIIACVRQGLSSREISSKINVSPKTVNVHRYNILKKLGLNNVAMLVDLANSKGL
jgi:DNA-binding NarL/FixJ family response regulator